MAAPRVFGIMATQAAVVAVIRRGPTDWCHLGRWDLDAMEYTPGSWLRGVIYPQRCDVSPDGRWFTYFTLKRSAGWDPGNAYIAISRLPWLTSLAAWGIGSTWTCGMHFVDDTEVWPSEPPDDGDPTPCRARYGLAYTRAGSFAVERRRGWKETAETPSRDPDDAWDQRRRVVMEKPHPMTSMTRLLVEGWYAAFRTLEPERFGDSWYSLDGVDGLRRLDDVQWADWARDGRLVVATRDGHLQWRDADGHTIRWQVDLASLTPDPQPPPAEAHRW